MWKRRRTRLFILFAIWLLPGVYFAVQVYLQRAYGGGPPEPREALMRGVVFWLLWAASSPIIYRLARTFPIPRREWLDGLLFHLPAGLIFSLAHLLVYVLATWWLTHGGPPDSLNSLLAEFQTVFIHNFAWWSLIYWTILVASYAFDYYQQYQQGLVRASHLETQLAQAQLEALKMQLHPHFLFNTLNSISALMHEDVELADQMIARLGEFLRMTLQNTGYQEISLQQELNYVRCYLDLEQIRFQDRLRTEIVAEPETLEARVPNLLLQPIVENAVRHGIARQREEGTVSIRVKHHQPWLQIDVTDTGPGLQPDRPAGKGIGLANTRERLKQLYGEDYRFEIRNLNEKGLIVSIEIPYQVNDRQILSVPETVA